VLLVIATLDSQPDPPAVNPSSNLCKVLPHNFACDTATERRDFVTTTSPFPLRLVAADAYRPHRPVDRMILTVHAADPSPPAHSGRRAPFFQS
jgi:hypothetical protein